MDVAAPERVAVAADEPRTDGPSREALFAAYAFLRDYRARMDREAMDDAIDAMAEEAAA